MLYADWLTIFGRPITVEQRCSNVVKTSFGRHLGFEFSEQVIYENVPRGIFQVARNERQKISLGFRGCEIGSTTKISVMI